MASRCNSNSPPTLAELINKKELTALAVLGSCFRLFILSFSGRKLINYTFAGLRIALHRKLLLTTTEISVTSPTTTTNNCPTS